ncbi:MAG: LysR family transcriptional regulator [Pseudomonadota bacterium]
MFALADYRAVIAIAEEAHFGRAARRLGCTQPSLSARLRRVEEELDARLFDRDRGGVRITPAGQAFVEGAERVVTAAVEAADGARAARAGLGQTIRIGMTQVSAYQVMVPVLTAFRNVRPRARLHLRETTTVALERGLEQNTLDVAFLHPPLHAPGLAEHEMTRAPLMRFDAVPDQPFRRPLIRYPRAEAPVLMGELSRGAAWDDAAGGEEAMPEIEADTMLGALVLSRAGFGPFATTEDYPTPFPKTSDCLRAIPTGADLVTAAAWRRLDRRPLVTELVDCAKRCAD